MKHLSLILAALIILPASFHAQAIKSGQGIFSTFEDLTLEPDTFWNGSDGSGGFVSGLARFLNDYNPDYFSWSGWSCSNMRDDSTAGFINQYSAITSVGYDTAASGGSNYAVAFVSFSPGMIVFTDTAAHEVGGFYVSNSTYAALSMENGDDFSKKFGGADGSDPDWFMLTVMGKLDGAYVDTVEFYLADFRDDQAEHDSILKHWAWVDLSGMGMVDTLLFSLSSSDVGEYGMNTPGYFCLDNLEVIPSQVVGHPGRPDAPGIQVYPNPSNGQFRIDWADEGLRDLRIYTMTGRLVLERKNLPSGTRVDMRSQPEGIYFLQTSDGLQTVSRRILKQ